MKLLDLFCGAGGAAVGYHRAGFTEIVGVDIAPQPRYPFAFVQADALEFLASTRADDYDLIHASPPCQDYSPTRHYNGKRYPRLIEPVRNLLEDRGRPYVIENVPGAPLRAPVVLCGQMFGLRVYRHRLFESSDLTLAPAHPSHREVCARNGVVPASDKGFMTITGGKHSRAWQRAACEVMGTPWMRTIREVCEAVPPAYTEWIGRQLIGAVS